MCSGRRVHKSTLLQSTALSDLVYADASECRRGHLNVLAPTPTDLVTLSRRALAGGGRELGSMYYQTRTLMSRRGRWLSRTLLVLLSQIIINQVTPSRLAPAGRTEDFRGVDSIRIRRWLALLLQM